jgi:hypothetical protein
MLREGDTALRSSVVACESDVLGPSQPAAFIPEKERYAGVFEDGVDADAFCSNVDWREVC